MKTSLIALCCLVPLLAVAQPSGGPPHPPFMERSWVSLLLEHRQDLGLSDTQVAQLQGIQDALKSKAAPMMQTLESLRPEPGTTSSEEEMLAHREQVHTTMRQLRDADTAAYQQAEALLTDAQKTKARALVSEETAAREKRRQELGPRMHPRGGPAPH
ncbi:Spy/CpxP family protein refolding chaperone [Myxococcaceae bacterium JPH2]|nr:Spy/CpxP family protein refolding chaperone [Myxococcaceae bacterium JPH2]